MPPRYVIVDPVGTYANRMMEFLARFELEAVAVFTSEPRRGIWRHKWSQDHAEHVARDFLVEADTDLDGIAAEIRASSPEGIVGIIPWDEMSILLGAQLARSLGLAWNSPDVIERCRDKHVMKAWLREHGGMRINASRVVTAAVDAEAFQEEVASWPIVVKPTRGAGSESVYFAHGPGQLLRACQLVLESESGEVLLEEYIGGREYVVNGMVDLDGRFLVTDAWLYDKRPSHGIPNLYFQTIKIGSDAYPFPILAEYAAAVVEALQLRRSPVHMEIKLDELGPCLVEVGARLAGGNQPRLASKLHGRSLFELAACHYLSDVPLSDTDVDFERYDRLEARVISGVQPFEVERVDRVWGKEEVESLPSFDGFGKLYLEGSRIPVTRDLDTKSYEVYLVHPDPMQIEHDARAVRYLLQYE